MVGLLHLDDNATLQPCAPFSYCLRPIAPQQSTCADRSDAPDDAAALSLDPDPVTYTALSDLNTATERPLDAPAIAICDA